MDLIDYVASLPPIKIARLYENPFTCLAIFRSLPQMAKFYVVRFIYTEGSLPQAVVTSWPKASAQSKHWAAIETLTRLQLLSPAAGKAMGPAYSLGKSFKQHMRGSMCSGVAQLIEAVPEEVATAAPTREAVDSYAAEQWEALLLFAVGGGSPPSPASHFQPSASLNLEDLLASAGVVDGTGDHRSVTQSGFQFLLSNTYTQLWQILKEYIARAERQSSAELSSVLGFLLQLGFQGECPLRASGLSPQQRDIAAHMVQLGVLAASRVGKDVWLHPTRLAVLMTSGSASSPATQEDGFVIVETNSRVYAYTSSPIRQAILRLFVRCDVLLPNLFVGTITRESAMGSLENGVSSEQIVGYLRQHAHPRVATRMPVVPGVVADQIRLWHRELQRLGASAGVLYKNFESEELFKQVAAYAEGLGAMLMKDAKKKEIVAAAEVHNQIREKIKEVKRKLGFV